jgi:hypothetical protein
MSSWNTVAFKIIGQRGEDRYVQLQIIKTPTKQYLFELREFYKEKSTGINVSLTLPEALWFLEFITSDIKFGRITKNKRTIEVEKQDNFGIKIYVYNYFALTFRYVILFDEELKTLIAEKDFFKNVIDNIIKTNKIEIDMNLYSIEMK